MEKQTETSATAATFELPLIETERLRLRMFEARDLDSAWRLFNDEKVQKYLSPENRRTRESLKITLHKLVERWRQRGFGLWCVSEKSDDAMRGYCGFQYLDDTTDIELAFAFHENVWGRGFATEAARASLRFAFESLRLEKVFAVTHSENTASRSVLETIGMTFEERAAHYGIDAVTYSISRQEFPPAENFYKSTGKNTI